MRGNTTLHGASTLCMLLQYVASTAEIHGQSLMCGARHEGPRTPQRTDDANLDWVFVKKTHNNTVKCVSKKINKLS